MSDLNQLIARTQNEMGYIEIGNIDGTPRQILPRRAANAITISLRNATELTQPANPLRVVRSGLPDASTPGSVVPLDKALVTGSRCVDAGSSVIIVPAYGDAKVINGEPVFEQRDVHFDLIEPTKATRVFNDEELPTAKLGIFRDYVNLENMHQVGVHVSLSRAEMRQYNKGQLAASAMASIVLGLGRAIDQTITYTILRGKPAVFSLPSVAVAGLRFGELRALCGTNAASASINSAGQLVVMTNGPQDTGGIAAELTDVMAETIVGDFSRCAVAVHDEIRLVADRTNARGDLTLTAFIGIQALLPRRDVFWVRG